MSKKWRYQNSCKGKIPHASGAAAFRQIQRSVKRKNLNTSQIMYRCPFCGEWHTAHATPEKHERNRPTRHELFTLLEDE